MVWQVCQCVLHLASFPRACHAVKPGVRRPFIRLPHNRLDVFWSLVSRRHESLLATILFFPVSSPFWQFSRSLGLTSFKSELLSVPSPLLGGALRHLSRPVSCTGAGCGWSPYSRGWVASSVSVFYKELRLGLLPCVSWLLILLWLSWLLILPGCS